MAMLIAVAGEQFGGRIVRLGLAPALALGAVSVLYRRVSGDLLPYVLVQAAALLSVTALLVFTHPHFPRRHLLGAGLALYACAKLAEIGDRAIYDASAGLIGGHALKHLLAALACGLVWAMLRARAER
jgi:hypothetical protein